MSYAINNTTLIVTRLIDSATCNFNDGSALWLEFQAWVQAGNLPSINISTTVKYRLEQYLDESILGTKPIEHFNFLTEVNTKLAMIEERHQGWPVNRRFYGYNSATGLHDILVIRENFFWTHDVYGFAKTMTLKYYYLLENNTEVLLKSYPPENISDKAIQIGRTRRQNLVNDLQQPVLQMIVLVVSNLSTAEMLSIGLDLGLLSAGGAGYILEAVARPFISSLDVYLVDYVNNHTLSELQDHLTARTELWLDKTVPFETFTIREYLLDNIS